MTGEPNWETFLDGEWVPAIGMASQEEIATRLRKAGIWDDDPEGREGPEIFR